MLYLSGAVRKGMPAMLSMGMGNRAPAEGLWAADSGRYNAPEKYTDEKYLAWLERHRWAANRCLFATAPDVVGDGYQTLILSVPMFARIQALGYPVAFVAQDGIDYIPWYRFDALFIGGTTKFKLSEQVRELCAEAKRRGKFLHMGRVNSYKRLKIASAFGCDSVDGTKLAFGPDVNQLLVERWLVDLHHAPVLL